MCMCVYIYINVCFALSHDYFIQVNRDVMVVPLAGAGGRLAVFEVNSLLIQVHH